MRWIILICRGRNRPRELSSLPRSAQTVNGELVSWTRRWVCSRPCVLHSLCGSSQSEDWSLPLAAPYGVAVLFRCPFNVTVSGSCGHGAVLPKSEACTVFPAKNVHVQRRFFGQVSVKKPCLAEFLCYSYLISSDIFSYQFQPGGGMFRFCFFFPKWVCIHSFIHSYWRDTICFRTTVLQRKKSANGIAQPSIFPDVSEQYNADSHSSLPLTSFLLSLSSCCHVSSFPPQFIGDRAEEVWGFFHKWKEIR